jgi:hypothetical protein
MSELTPSQWLNKVNSKITTNNNKENTAKRVRESFEDIPDSVKLWTGLEPAVNANTLRVIQSSTLKDASSSNQTHSMPAITTGIDGYIYEVLKEGQYKLTIQPNGLDSIGDSGSGHGVETLDTGEAGILLRANFAKKKWHIVNTVGRWAVEGVNLYLPLSFQGTYQPTSPAGLLAEEVYGLNALSTPAVPMNTADVYGTGIVSSTIDLNGTTMYAYIPNPVDKANMFGSLTDNQTLSIRVKFDNATIVTNEMIVGQYEDANNYWLIYRDQATEEIVVLMASGGVTKINLFSTTAITDTNWHQIDVVKVNDDVAIYIDTAHGDNGTLSGADTFTGGLYFGQSGASVWWLDGSLSDFALINQNIYGVDPTDSGSTVPTKIKPGGYIYE